MHNVLFEAARCPHYRHGGRAAEERRQFNGKMWHREVDLTSDTQ
jgi:hypothetical protein